MSVKCSGVERRLTLEEGKMAWGSPGEVPCQVEACCTLNLSERHETVVFESE